MSVVWKYFTLKEEKSKKKQTAVYVKAVMLMAVDFFWEGCKVFN